MSTKKNEELKFLYTDKKHQGTKKQKPKTKSSRAESKKSARKNDKINLDNEIIIGVTKIPESNKTAKKKNTGEKKSKKNKTNKNVKQKKKNNKNVKKNESKNRIIKGLIKWTILICALIASFIYFMMTPLFNLAEIEVVNNKKISTDTIISESSLTLGENIYKTSIKTIKENIKQNAYIDSVDIKRKLPNKILITIKERKATYNLEYGNSYAYINNQGYILEISSTPLDLPIIEGYTTMLEDIKPGNRLNGEDLEKLGTVLKIMESANANNISVFVTRINIEDKQNYTLILQEERKTVYLGDASNLSNRMLYVKAIITEEKETEGEIFANGDLNKSNVYFRKKEG